jgi:hypothetical protein
VSTPIVIKNQGGATDIDPDQIRLTNGSND